jgi:6-pyruvoyltetrahydropterin/6-carboxytetrahydropterin synthase
MRSLCDEIDHKVLLPLHNPKLDVTERDGSVTVAYEGKAKYVFPVEDCVLLDIPNTTVEMLAQHLAARVRDAMNELGVRTLTAIELEVEENFGQSATYRESPVATTAEAPRSRRT